ncbi:MAG TPA: hypothetical protein VG937_00550 [Polyangiaceae bacterium]|nr:hypothetical protein [Polyangiaceae bacterium]
MLIGAGLVAGVLWRGLDRVAQAMKTQSAVGVRVAPAAAGLTAASAQAAAPSIATAATVNAAVPESAEASRNRVSEQAEMALARQRPDYVRACWKPAPPVPGEPPDFGGAFEIEIKFDASGLETSRTVLSGAYARPLLLACVRAAKLAALRIPAPGEAVTVTVHMPVP